MELNEIFFNEREREKVKRKKNELSNGSIYEIMKLVAK